MNTRNPITLISQAIDMIGDDLDGHPMTIERPGKEDFVLVSSQTYSDLVARVHQLEEAVKTPKDREVEEEELLRAMADASDADGVRR